MSDEQEVITTVTKGVYSEAECGIAAPEPPTLDKPIGAGKDTSRE